MKYHIINNTKGSISISIKYQITKDKKTLISMRETNNKPQVRASIHKET